MNMKRINKNNKIFQSVEFEKDKYKFYIALKILADNNSSIYSDEKEYAIMQMNESLPIWIWTRDDIDSKCVDEIILALKLHYNKNCKIICKTEFYNLLLEKNVDIDKKLSLEIGTLFCKKTISPRIIKGHMEIAKITDLDILSKYWYDDYVEMENDKYSLTQAENDMKDMINEGNFYVLKDENGKIVCMARYTYINDVASINKVYTPVEERRKGYCSNLIYNLTNMLLSIGKIPVLYTDVNYIPSNKSYLNVGYLKNGTLESFYLDKNKNKLSF